MKGASDLSMVTEEVNGRDKKQKPDLIPKPNHTPLNALNLLSKNCGAKEGDIRGNSLQGY